MQTGERYENSGSPVAAAGYFKEWIAQEIEREEGNEKECLRKEVDKEMDKKVNKKVHKEMHKKMYGGKAFRWRQRRI